MTCDEVYEKVKFVGDEKLTQDEVEMLMDLEDEYSRRGKFDRAFLNEANVARIGQLFEVQRYQNCLIKAYLQSEQDVKDKLLPKRVYFTEISSGLD